MKLIALAALLLPIAVPAQAAEAPPAERAAVLAVVDAYLDALNRNDLTGMAALSHHDAMTHAIFKGKDGTWQQRFKREGDALVPRPDEPGYHERYWDPVVLIDGPLAQFWAPYDFYLGGTFSHCGINNFTLVKLGDDWKLANSSWTMLKEGCALHPDGPPPGAK